MVWDFYWLPKNINGRAVQNYLQINQAYFRHLPRQLSFQGVRESRGIFGPEFRPSLTPDSDITASSELGVDGTVEISHPDAKAAGLVELPSALDDPSNQIISGCAANQGNELYIFGRGGLPQSPTEMLWGQTVWQDLRWLEIEDKSQTNRVFDRNRVSSNNFSIKPLPSSPIVEATGWVVNPDGSVKLVGSASGFLRSPQCGAL